MSCSIHRPSESRGAGVIKVSLLRPALASEPSIAPSRAPGFSLMPTGLTQACSSLQGAFEQGLHVSAHDGERNHAEIRQRRVAPTDVGHVEKDPAETMVRGILGELRSRHR